MVFSGLVFGLFPMDGHVLWCVNTDPHLLASNLCDGYGDVISDGECLALFTSQY